MRHTKIGTVMTRDVITAEVSTGFKDVARLLGENRISGLPVIDADEKVLGVVSETDLLLRQAADAGPGEPGRRHRPVLTRGARAVVVKERAGNAGMLMSAPAVTIHADESIAAAARTMAQTRVERLPVVDEEDRLVGIVTRRDVLQVFLRSDEDIHREVVQDVIVGALWLTPQTLEVSVENGVVTLKGKVERRSEKPIAVHMTRQVDGVVSVVDQLTYRFDDSRRRPADQALHSMGEKWLRSL